MQINFIGHGLDVKNRKTVGNILVDSFKDLKFDQFTALVAFASSGAIKNLLPHISSNANRFKKIKFYVGIDEQGTSEEALALFLENNLTTFIYHTKSMLTFHPKIYIFEGEKWCRVIIGSANFTQKGLFINIESSLQLDFKPNDAQGNKVLKQIKDYYRSVLDDSDKNLKLLTDELFNFLREEKLLCVEENLFNNKSKISNSELTIFPTKEQFKIVSEELGNISLPEELLRTRYNKFTQNDIEKFHYFFEKWKRYKRDNPKSAGIVNRDTEDRELHTWYRKIKDLSSAGIQIPIEYLKLLNDENFPFKDGKEIQRMIIWEERFLELIDYKNKFKLESVHVPQFKNANKYSGLGSWCAVQKQRRKGNTTPKWTEYEEEKLNSINFEWSPPPRGGKIGGDDELWLENYFNLEKYKAEFGHANPSQVDQNPEVRKLAKWVNTQRTLKSVGKKEKKHRRFLDSNREQLLIEVGVDFEWELNKTKKELEEFIKVYLEFKEVYPDEKIKRGDKRFSKMLQKRAQIRYRYKNDHSESNKWRLDMLNKVGFVW